MFPHASYLSLVLSLLYCCVFSAPVPSSSESERWTIRGFHWNCSDDGSICVYGFSIKEEPQNGTSTAPVYCHFAVRAPDGSSALKSSFSDVPCEDLTFYRCAGGWGGNGVMMLTVDNIEKRHRAYFRYSDEDMASMDYTTPVESFVYTIGTGSPSGLSSPASLVKREEHDDDAYYDLDEAPAYPEYYEYDNDESYDLYDEYNSTPDYDDYYEPQQEDNSIADVAAQDDQLPEYGCSIGSFDEQASEEFAGSAEKMDVEPTEIQSDEQNNLSDGGSNTTPSASDTNDTTDVSPNDSEQPPLESQFAGETGDFVNSPDTDSNIVGQNNMIVPEETVSWSVRGVSRTVEYWPNIVKMAFLIDVLPFGPTGIPCNLYIEVGDASDPVYTDWAVQQCRDSGWFASWGYNKVNDSAVVTLINPERNREAWFGWNDVNARLATSTLDPAGPNVVQICDC